MKDHVDSVISYGSIEIAGNIYEKTIDIESSVSSWLRLY